MKLLYKLLLAALILTQVDVHAQVVTIAGALHPSGIAIFDTDLYISEVGSDKITKADLTEALPTTTEDYILDLVNPYIIASHGDYFYFIEESSTDIFRVDVTKPTLIVETFLTGLADITIDMAFKDGAMFFGQESSIYKASVASAPSTPTLVATTEEYIFPSHLKFKGSVLYFSVGTSTIMTVNVETVEPIFDHFFTTADIFYPSGFVIDGDYLYLTDGYFALRRINLLVSPLEVEVVHDFFPASPYDVLKHDGEFYISLTTGGFKVVKLADSTTTDLSNEFLKSINLYPNPTSNLLKVSLEIQPEAWEILDITGKRMNVDVTLNGTYLDIDVSNQIAGVYQLVLFKDDEIFTFKFIKQ